METSAIADFLQDTFDFLIIGGGTAGLVLAARLSENPNVRVGVIEAGLSGLGDPKVELPTGASMMLNNPDYDWNFRSVPQVGLLPCCMINGRLVRPLTDDLTTFLQRGTKDKVYHIPRGKMLGGSSGINYMAYGRPCAADVDDWSNILGIPGWSWADLLAYFKKSEHLEIGQPNIENRDLNDCPIDQELHGVGGAIHTSMGTWQVPFEKALLRALDEVSGIPRPREPYNGSHLGFYRSLFTTDRTGKPTRSYAGNGYLAPNAGRTNLRVLTSTIARRVILEKDQNGVPVASGVELQHRGDSYSAFAKREVILSAGSLQSPQILELSGIGDPKVLGEAGISCVLPNPEIGNNLQEHVMSAVTYELADGVMSLDSISRDPELLKEHQILYAENHTGAMSGSVSLMGYISYSSQVSEPVLEDCILSLSSSPLIDERSPPQNDVLQKKQQEAIAARMRGPDSADIQIVGTPANFDTAKGFSDSTKLMAGAPVDYNPCYSIVVSNMYPISRGNVHIQSSGLLDAPLIDPGFLTHQADADILAAGLDFADRVFQSASLKDKVARRVRPPPELDLRNKDDAQEYVRDHVVSYHHALGTCAMGQVVDERLRVKGVHQLRVVDASVLPMQVSTAILSTVYALAEKGADMIKEDYGTGKI